MDSKIGGLAETLKSLGIVSSASDAINLAKNIVTTEEKVAKCYGKITPAQGKTKSYQEEIDELIRKTSPEYKNYHIPVKGYVREDNKNDKIVNNTQKAEKQVFYELEEPKFTNNSVEKKAEVYTDIENSEKILNELVSVEQQTEQEDVMVNSTPLLFSEEPNNEKKSDLNQNSSQNDFIIEIKEVELPKNNIEVTKNEIKEKPEQLFKEIKVDKTPHEIKNPIEAVDLMNYFKAK